MDNPENMTTQGTQDTRQINVREYQRGNQKWTIQRNWQHWIHNIQDIQQVVNKHQRKPKAEITKVQSRKTGNIGYIRRQRIPKG